MSRFSQDISDWCKDSMAKADQILRVTANRALVGVVKRSRVDTGRFLRNWRVSINSTDLTVNPDGFSPSPADAVQEAANRQQASAEALARGQQVIAKAKFGQNVSISDDVPYAPHLEALDGTVAITAAEVAAQIPRDAEAIANGSVPKVTP